MIDRYTMYPSWVIHTWHSMDEDVQIKQQVHISLCICSCVQGASFNTSVNLQLLINTETTIITQAQSVKHSADTRQGGNNTNMLRIGWRPPRDDSLLPIDKLSQGFKQCCDVLSPPSYLPPPPPSVNNWHVSTFYANLAQDMPPLPRSCKSMPLLCSPCCPCELCHYHSLKYGRARVRRVRSSYRQASLQAVFLLAGMYTWADWPVKISVNSMLLAQYNVIDCIASHIYEEQKHDREVKAAHWRMTCQVLAYCTRPCVPPWVPANHSTGNILNLQLAEHKLVDGTTGNSRPWTSTSIRSWVPTGHPSVKRPGRRFTDLIITVTTPAVLEFQGHLPEIMGPMVNPIGPQCNKMKP